MTCLLTRKMCPWLAAIASVEASAAQADSRSGVTAELPCLASCRDPAASAPLRGPLVLTAACGSNVPALVHAPSA